MLWKLLAYLSHDSLTSLRKTDMFKSVSRHANHNLLRNTKPKVMKDNLDLCGNDKDYIVHFTRQR